MGGKSTQAHRGESPIARFVCLAVGFAMATVGWVAAHEAALCFGPKLKSKPASRSCCARAGLPRKPWMVHRVVGRSCLCNRNMTSKARTTCNVSGRRCCSAEGDLCGKDRTLCVEIRTAQTVEAAFAHLHHFGQGEEVGEGGEVAVEPKIGIGRPPRVDAGRIQAPDLRVPRFGVEHDRAGKTHNAGAGGRVEAVRVEIKGGSGVLHKWIQGTGS